MDIDFDEAGPSSRPQSYDNCIYYNRSDCSNSEHSSFDSEPPELYADRSKENVSIFPGEEFVYRDSEEVEDEAFLDCGKPAKLFESLVGFVAHVESHLRDDTYITKDQVLGEIKGVRQLLIQNADIFDQMTDFLVSKHLSGVESLQYTASDKGTSEDASSGVFSDENAYESKPQLTDDIKVLGEKSINTENVSTPKYNLRAPKPKFSKYDSKDDKENSNPKQKPKKQQEIKKKEKRQVKRESSRLKINPVADKFAKNASKMTKKIEVKHKDGNLKGNPVAIQSKLVDNLRGILKQLPMKVQKADLIIKKSNPVLKKPNPILKKSNMITKKKCKPPTYKLSETNVRTSKRPRARRTVYFAGERLYLNANGTLSRVDDVEHDTGNKENQNRDTAVKKNKRKSECLLKDYIEEPVKRNKMNVNLKGSQSLPVIKKRKLYSPDEWMMSLNERGIGDY